MVLAESRPDTVQLRDSALTMYIKKERKTGMATKKTTTKVSEAKVEKEKELFSKEEVNELIAKAVAEAIARTQTSVVQVSTEKPMVKMCYMDDCADDNVIFFGVNGKFGSITGPIGYINVTKESWLGEFRDNIVQSLLAKRKLIVLDGLTDEERTMHNVNYAKGEILDENLFRTLLDHIDELPEVYKNLCPSMKQIVATRFQTGYDNNDPRVLRNRDIVVKLNRISKKDFLDAPESDPRKEGLFINIVRGLNKNDEE